MTTFLIQTILKKEYPTIIGYYPGWNTGCVRDYLNGLREDGQRKKAAAKLDFDLHMLETTWPRPLGFSSALRIKRFGCCIQWKKNSARRRPQI